MGREGDRNETEWERGREMVRGIENKRMRGRGGEKGGEREKAKMREGGKGREERE